MRCKSCDHTLWNLPGNTCPECGTLFSRSLYEFQPYAVIFKCPHCAQPYYGAGAKGHLVPPEFECQSCHNSITMESCVLLPVPGRELDAVAVGVPVPWTTEGSIFKRFWATCLSALISPRVLGLAISTHEPRLKRASTFFVAVVGLLLAVSLVCLFGQSALMVFALGAAGGPSSGSGGVAVPTTALFASQLGPGFLIGMITPIAYAMYIPIAAAVGALTFRMLGGDLMQETARVARTLPFARAMEILLWSSGTLLVSLVPCVGSFAAVWWVVSAAIMTSAFVTARASQAASARGAVAMVVGMVAPILVGCGVAAVGVYFLVASAMSSMVGSPSGGPNPFSMSPNASAPIVAPLAPEVEDEVEPQN